MSPRPRSAGSAALALLFASLGACAAAAPATPAPATPIAPAEPPPVTARREAPAPAYRWPAHARPASAEPVIPIGAGRVGQLVLAPDGALVASLTGDGVVLVQRVADGQIVGSLRPWVRGFAFRQLQFDRSGRRLLVIGVGDPEGAPPYFVWDLHTGQLEHGRVVDRPGPQFAFHPSGDRVAMVRQVSGGAPMLVEMPLGDGEPREYAMPSSAMPRQLVYTVGGQLFGATPTGTFCVRDGALHAFPERAGRAVPSVVPLPEVDAVLLSERDGSLRFVSPDCETIREVPAPESVTGRPLVAAAQHDPARVVASVGEKLHLFGGLEFHALDTIDAPRPVSALSGPIDGQFIAVRGSDLVRIDIRDERLTLEALAERTSMRNPAVLPDGTGYLVGTGTGVSRRAGATTDALWSPRDSALQPSLWGVEIVADGQAAIAWGRSLLTELLGPSDAPMVTECGGRGVVTLGPPATLMTGLGRCAFGGGPDPAYTYIAARAADAPVVLAREPRWTVHRADGESVRLRVGRGFERAQAQLSRDGGTATLQVAQRVELYDTARGRRLARARLGEGEVAGPLPNGAGIVSRAPASIRIFDRRGRLRAALGLDPEHDVSVAGTRDGQRVAVWAGTRVLLLGLDGEVRPLDERAPEAPRLRFDAERMNDAAHRRALRVSADDQNLVLTTPETLRVYALESGDLLRETSLVDATADRDGTRVARCREGRLTLIDQRTLEERSLGACFTAARMHFGPAGRFLVHRFGARARIVRIRDGRWVEVRTVYIGPSRFGGDPDGDTSGTFVVDDRGRVAARPEIAEVLRYREAGSLDRARVVPLSDHDALGGDWLPAFFAAPEADAAPDASEASSDG